VATEVGRSYTLSFLRSPGAGVQSSGNMFTVYRNGTNLGTVARNGKGLTTTWWQRTTFTVTARATTAFQSARTTPTTSGRSSMTSGSSRPNGGQQTRYPSRRWRCQDGRCYPFGPRGTTTTVPAISICASPSSNDVSNVHSSALAGTGAGLTS
jgi:hypothetical protein